MATEIKKSEVAGVPAARYRDPFAEMRTEMDRVFEAFLGRSLFGRSNLPRVAAPDLVAPHIDIRENETEIVLEAELPGIDEKDVAVVVKNGVLSLKGEKKYERDEKKDAYRLTERSYGSFERMFELPEGIDEDNIKANFDKGVLRITVPKRPGISPVEKKITIQAG
jgi:HSP20 family protein